jgi:tetratricopeptide (TPR) repeat protein
MSDDQKIDGIFHEVKQISAGTMGTARTHDAAHELHYYCKSNAKGEVVLYYLKPDGTATAIEMETVPRESFDARFKPTEAGKFGPKSDDDRKKEEAGKKVAMAEGHLERKEFNAAAFEFGQAIKKDDKNLRAHLGKGKAHLALGEHDKAKESFQNLAQIDTLYEEENKHLFNEYGIELRRGKMYELAIENYEKAISIDPTDEALYFNMARAYYEAGQPAEAGTFLKKALEIRPDFREAKLLHDAIAKTSLNG